MTSPCASSTSRLGSSTGGRITGVAILVCSSGSTSSYELSPGGASIGTFAAGAGKPEDLALSPLLLLLLLLPLPLLKLLVDGAPNPAAAIISLILFETVVVGAGAFSTGAEFSV